MAKAEHVTLGQRFSEEQPRRERSYRVRAIDQRDELLELDGDLVNLGEQRRRVLRGRVGPPERGR